jgi:hypothetical protein
MKPGASPHCGAITPCDVSAIKRMAAVVETSSVRSNNVFLIYKPMLQLPDLNDKEDKTLQRLSLQKFL